MTEFKDYRDTKEIELPTSGATVTVYDGLLAGDIAKMPQNEGETDKITSICAALIKDWDFEKDGKKVEITKENIDQLHMNDLTAIVKKMDLQNLPQGDGQDTGDKA